jgi:hypothetical protein
MNSEALKAFIRRTFCVTDSEFEILRWLIRELDLVEFEENRNKEAIADVE